MVGPIEKLAAKGVSRRDFVKLCAATTAAFGLSKVFVPQVVEAAETAVKKPAVIWLEGQDCAGCSESLLATLKPDAATLVLDVISLRYHETIMAGAGEHAEEARRKTMEEGGYVLVVEGSIPLADDRFCKIGGKSFREMLLETAKNAAAIVAVGACATYGGIPKAGPTNAAGVLDVIKDKPVINLPMCPGKPSQLVATLLYFITFKRAPELDKYGRPKVFYSNLLHDNCPRRGHFENGQFLTDWNDPSQKEWCLLMKGCKGPKTYTDCAQVWWNDGANFCINAGSPCSGCAQPEFYADFNPLYTKTEMFNLPGLGQMNVDSLGKAIGGLAAAGVAVHLAGKLITGNGSEKDSKGVGK